MAKENKEYELTPEKLQQETENKSASPYFYPQMDNGDLVRLALNQSDIIEDLRIKILGLEWDQKINDWRISTKIKPMMTERGLYPILSMASSTIVRNTTLSKLDKEEARKLALEIEQSTNDSLLNYFSDGRLELNTSNWQMINVKWQLLLST